MVYGRYIELYTSWGEDKQKKSKKHHWEGTTLYESVIFEVNMEHVGIDVCKKYEF